MAELEKQLGANGKPKSGTRIEDVEGADGRTPEDEAANVRGDDYEAIMRASPLQHSPCG